MSSPFLTSLVRVLATGTGLLYAYSYWNREYGGGLGAKRELVVVGIGRVECRPDLAKVRFGVKARESSAKQASDRLNTTIKAVLQALHDLPSLEERDIRTTRLSLHEERTRVKTKDSEDSEVYRSSYVAQSHVEVKVRMIDELGVILDTASEAGVNEVESVDFDLQHPEPLRQQARTAAIADAKSQARSMARDAGLRLGRLMSIKMGAEDEPIHGHSTMLSQAISYSGSIATGELVIEEAVRVRYEVSDP